jgi:hypothetical protein
MAVGLSPNTARISNYKWVETRSSSIVAGVLSFSAMVPPLVTPLYFGRNCLATAVILGVRVRKH